MCYCAIGVELILKRNSLSEYDKYPRRVPIGNNSVIEIP